MERMRIGAFHFAKKACVSLLFTPRMDFIAGIACAWVEIKLNGAAVSVSKSSGRLHGLL
jgi:hypothetical protein